MIAGDAVERRDIEIFLTLAEELHFTRAAQRLHVTPARVSQTIKLMERRIGAALFERTSRRVALTAIGQRLNDDLRPAHDQLAAGIERAVRAARTVTGTLRVGFVGAVAGQFILEVARLFHDRHTECEVHIRENQVNDGFALLRTDQIEILFTVLPVNEPDLTTSEVLVRESGLLAVSARHPFARLDSITLADLARTVVLRSPESQPPYWDHFLVPPDMTPERGPTFTTIQEMLALVSAGKGAYPVPEQACGYYARPDVAYVPIRDAPPWEWVLVWRAAETTQRIKEFTRAAHDLAKPNQTGWPPQHR
jgi:DNA-binding transcriptional LysR family regulator